jgi:hypothetical protein
VPGLPDGNDVDSNENTTWSMTIFGCRLIRRAKESSALDEQTSRIVRSTISHADQGVLFLDCPDSPMNS